MLEIISTLTFIGYVAFGSFIRILLGVYKAYDTFPDFQPEFKRLAAEMMFSICFGGLGLLVLSEMHVFNFGLEIAAIIMGVLGPDTIRIITKKVGIIKPTEAIVSEQQMKNADLSGREIRALEYVKRYGRITNKIYQKLNQIDHDIAKKELHILVEKGRLMRTGYNKNSQYTIVSEEPGHLRAVSGTSISGSRKSTHKSPGRNAPSVKSRFEPAKRVLQKHDFENN